MKVLFISKELQLTSGSGVGARMHRDCIRDIVGEENLYVVDLGINCKPCKSERYVAYGKYKSKLNRIIRHLQGHTYLFSNSIITDICDLIRENKIDFVFLDDSTFGELAKTIKKKNPTVKVVAFFHDVKAELFPIWMKSCSFIDKIDCKFGMKNERTSVNIVDANIVLNQAENDLLIKHYGKNTDYYLPVCVNKEVTVGENPYITSDKKNILFVGTAYKPNIDGLNWFYENVFDRINDTYDIWVLGKGLECLRDKYAHDKNIHIVGFAESLADYYYFADAVIAPLTDGGGMKIKTAEALSYGKTFIGSSESLHGYYEEIPEIMINKVIFRCDTVEEYLKAFEQLKNEEIIQKNEMLVDLYNEKYSAEAACNIMKHIIEETMGRKI